MSKTYALRPREGTQTFHKITTGRKWVGRVCQHEDGSWIGIIGKLMTTGHPSARAAFDDVVAKHFGYPNVAALEVRNRAARQATKVVNRAADHIIDEVLRGNFKPLDRAIDAGLPGMQLAIRGLNRSLRRGR